MPALENLNAPVKTPLPIVFLIGPFCSGKSTLGLFLASEFNLHFVSLRDRIRQLRPSPLPAHRAARDSNENHHAPGSCAPTLSQTILRTIQDIVVEAEKTGKYGVLIEGFPAEYAQLQAFEVEVKKLPPIADIAINLICTKPQAQSRYMSAVDKPGSGTHGFFDRFFGETEAAVRRVGAAFGRKGVLVNVDAFGNEKATLENAKEALEENLVWKERVAGRFVTGKKK